MLTVIVRIVSDCFHLVVSLIDFLLNGRPVKICIGVIMGIDNLFLDCAQDIQLTLHSTFGNLQQTLPSLHILLILAQRADTHPHFLGNRIFRRSITRTIDFHPAGYFLQLFIQCLLILFSLPQCHHRTAIVHNSHHPSLP